MSSKFSTFQPDIWQEYDCPVNQSDYELSDGEICVDGERFFCPLCSGYHTAGQDGPDQTMLVFAEDEPIVFRELPRDEKEKAQWIEEVEAARLQYKQDRDI